MLQPPRLILKKPDRNHYTFYLAYDYPMPISDRDVVIDVRIKYDFHLGQATATLTASRTPLVPVKDGAVRITDLKIQFILVYLNRKKTGIVYTSRVDPGGHIPDFLINLSNKRALNGGFMDIRGAIKKKEYIEAAKASQDFQVVEKLVNNRAGFGFKHKVASVINPKAGNA